jgi:hypothetical protein
MPGGLQAGIGVGGGFSQGDMVSQLLAQANQMAQQTMAELPQLQRIAQQQAMMRQQQGMSSGAGGAGGTGGTTGGTGGTTGGTGGTTGTTRT